MLTTVFLSTLPARGATEVVLDTRQDSTFLSTLPARGATPVLDLGSVLLDISIHAPREGSDGTVLVLRGRGRISIHAPREGSDYFGRTLGMQREISIHAPREGSDLVQVAGAVARQDFYPRSPRGERRLAPPVCLGNGVFLSTLPARGATAFAPLFNGRHKNFYPRSPRGERQLLDVAGVGENVISIHAPREGSDLWILGRHCHAQVISIHAPREGSDPFSVRRAFNRSLFLSTLPARGATWRTLPNQRASMISIHAPREGSD